MTRRISTIIRDTMRRRRMAAGLTQAAVAEDLLVEPDTVGKWERGEQAPTWEGIDAWWAATAPNNTRRLRDV